MVEGRLSSQQSLGLGEGAARLAVEVFLVVLGASVIEVVGEADALHPRGVESALQLSPLQVTNAESEVRRLLGALSYGDNLEVGQEELLGGEKRVGLVDNDFESSLVIFEAGEDLFEVEGAELEGGLEHLVVASLFKTLLRLHHLAQLQRADATLFVQVVVENFESFAPALFRPLRIHKFQRFRG